MRKIETVKKKYAIGVDFGTLSARALLVDADTGIELASSEMEYPHGVIDKEMPSGEPLPPSWALQDPQDYLDAFYQTVREVTKEADVDVEEIIGVGIDFTTCTILPVLEDGTPLSMVPGFENNPHAYVKLWKHHAAQYCADIVNETAERMNEPWLPLYGGKISSEWQLPKILQIVKEAPEIYEKCRYIIEAGDWMTWMLTGTLCSSACMAGYKGQHHYQNGYPDSEYLKALDPAMENLVADKFPDDIAPLGKRVGYLTKRMAAKTGLTENTAVAVAVGDAHASVPASKISGSGEMLMIMGTSNCHMMIDKEEKAVKGMCGVVKDGMIPGYFGYEAGQSCFGDHFSWFMRNLVPEHYAKAARSSGMTPYEYMTALAERQKPGECGLLALDWWNGVRSTLMDFDLSGMMVGMTLATKPEDIFRALLDAVAFGTRKVVDAFNDAGLPVHKLVAAGGIAAKNPLLMQIIADVTQLPVVLTGSAQSGALGSAIFAIAAAGEERSGYADISLIIDRIGRQKDVVYQPIADNAERYGLLYAEYQKLYEYFGAGGNDVMKALRRMK